jgi:dihydroorotate dehydrogenase
MYKVLKQFLFRLDPETAHHFIFKLLKLPGFASLASTVTGIRSSGLEKEVIGLKFKTPVGLAAGLDKDAIAFNQLGTLGFGFVEIGTVTPKPQPGNDKPRLFRLVSDEALINRMGFNNHGSKAAAKRLQFKKDKNLIIGGNIGKNKTTPNEAAVEDYCTCFEDLYPVVDYFVVNVSSPNTPNLRELQEKEPLTALLAKLQSLNKAKSNPKPILLKIAPDLTDEQLDDIIEIVKETHIAGVIATNTTISRNGLTADPREVTTIGPGGLSGKPLTKRSTEVIRYLKTKSQNSFPVIGVGGIHTAADAMEKLDAGADLIQLYTGFIYYGPDLLADIYKELNRRK